MADYLTKLQRINGLLSEMSEEAMAYFFPGGTADREEILYCKRFDSYHADFAECAECASLESDSFRNGRPGSVLSDALQPALGSKIKKHLRLFRSKVADEEREVESPVATLEPDSKTKAILDEIEALQKKYGITIEEFEALLAYRVKLSRLRVTLKKELLLEDFDRREVRMDTLTKAVFLLYLRHPEGIRYKALSDHQAELERIYSSITGREDLGSIRKSVSDLCDPLNNSINEKVSKVKKAFRDAVDDHIARFYYIDGERGTAKRIALDRDYVIWDSRL